MNIMDENKVKDYNVLKRSIIIAISCIVYWALFVGYAFAWLYGLDSIARAILFILLISALIIIGSVIVVVYGSLRDVMENRAKSIKKIIPLIILILIISTNSFLYVTLFKSEMYSSSGFYTLVGKNEENRNYFFLIRDNHVKVKIKCSKDIYNQIIVDKNIQYHLSYRYIAINKGKGVLEGYFDTTPFKS